VSPVSLLETVKQAPTRWEEAAVDTVIIVLLTEWSTPGPRFRFSMYTKPLTRVFGAFLSDEFFLCMEATYHAITTH